MAFELAARLGSFKSAAAELHITPSAVSQQIRVLEEALGFSLFERKHREVAITEQGKLYWESVAELLAALDRDTYRVMQRARRAVLRVTTEAFLANEYLVPNMAGFRASAPGVDLRVETGMAVVDLKREPVDAAVRWATDDPGGPGLRWVELQRQELVLVCAPEMAATLPLPAGLEDAPIVCIESRYDELQAGIAQSFGIELRPSSLLLVDSFYSMVRAAERGQGVTFAFRPMIDPWLEAGRLVRLPGVAGPFSSALYFGCLEREADRPELCALRAWLQALFPAEAGLG